MRKTTLLLAFIATTATAAEAQNQPQKVDFVADFEAIEPPVTAVQMWTYVQQCSGLTPKTGHDFADIKWFRGPLRATDPQHLIVAHWAPDTILIDATFPLYNVIIAHELMHQLLFGPDDADESIAHPTVFTTCKLMPSQYPDILSAQANQPR